MAANAVNDACHHAKDAEFDGIMNQVLSDADRVIQAAMAELDIATIKGTEGDSRAEIVDYLQAKLRESYTTNRKLRVLVPSLVSSELSVAIANEISVSDRDDVTALTSVTDSLQYDTFKSNIQDSIDEVTDQLTHDCHWLTLDDSDRRCGGGGQFADSQWSLGSNSTGTSPSNYDTSSLASSYGAAYWEMLSGDRLDELADHLDIRNHWSLRRNALRTLSSLPLAEVVGFDEWPKLRARLRCMLIGCDTEAFHYGIRFHVKMLRNTSSQCVVESYVNLVEALRALYETGYPCTCDRRAASTAHSNDTFNQCSVRQNHVLQLSKLVNTVQKVIPQYWTRYSELQVEKIVEQTIRYLLDVDPNFRSEYDPSVNEPTNSSKSSFDRISTPVHGLAMIDPRADWFDAWTCADQGKRIVMRVMKRHGNVLSRLANSCLTAFDNLNLKECSASSTSSQNRDTVSDEPLIRAQSAYLCLLHATRILGHVLRNAEGKALFDSQLESSAHSDFLASVLRAAFVASRSTHSCNEFCLGRVVVEVFDGLIAYETNRGHCFDDEAVLQIVLDDMRHFVAGLQHDKLFGIDSCELHHLDHLTSFINQLANSYSGLQAIVARVSLQQQSTVELITLFAERLLLMMHEDFVPSTHETVEAIRTKLVRICCRLLSDHKGIVELKDTGILYKIAEEWEARLRESDQTPIMGQTAANDAQLATYDWLSELSVVGRTPMGVVSLYRTDLLQDVLNWTETKILTNKRMISVDNTTMLLLSQTASLCCECPKLTAHLTPIVNQIATAIWSASELWSIGSDEIIPHAEESLTRTTDNLLADLVCILPSSEAITRLFTTTTTTSDSYDSSQSYLVKLVMSGIQNWYQRSELTCCIGLRLLSLLGTDLNTWLYLESNFNFQEMLLRAQVSEDYEYPIVDQHSLLRNYLLVKITEIGGEDEKRLPPLSYENFNIEKTLQEWPMVTSLPIPQEYFSTPFSALSSPPSDIKFFLKESHSDGLDSEWLVYCREVFRNCLTDENVRLRGKWFGELLYLATEALFRTATIIPFSSKEDQHSEVSFDNNLGCQLVISYGLRLGLLDDGVRSVYDLIQTLSSLQDANSSKSFDWLTATVFLLTNGDVDRTTTFVNRLQRLPQGQQLSGLLTTSDLEIESNNHWAVFCHNVEVVLRGDLPLVANALVRSRMSVGQICRPWIVQCFWNVLNWEEICTYVGLCVLMGADYEVYYVVAIFRHLQKEILRHVALNDFSLFIRETRLEGFCTRDNLPFIDHLESKYRGILLQKRF